VKQAWRMTMLVFAGASATVTDPQQQFWVMWMTLIFALCGKALYAIVLLEAEW